jgi:uncharacterized protein
MSATDARRPVPAPPGGLRSRVARHPLSAFLVLVAVVGWPLMSVPALTTHGVLPGGPLPQEPFALGTTLLVMLPAALWVTAVADGRPAVRALLRRAVRWRFGAGWWATVLLALPVLTLAVGVAAGQGLQTGDLLAALASGAFSLATAVLLVHLWEETVWAGFFQGRLEQRHGFLPAAALTAVPFAAVHLPLAFIGDLTAARVGLAVGALFVLGVVMRLWWAPPCAAPPAACWPPGSCTRRSTPRTTRATWSTTCSAAASRRCTPSSRRCCSPPAPWSRCGTGVSSTFSATVVA